MPATFDLHLSAYRLASETIRKVEALGFKRDEFTNNTRCDTTVYHGTFRGSRILPDDSLWDQLERVFRGDPSFVGGLEEEEFDPMDIVQLNGTSLAWPRSFRPLGMSRPVAGTYKACDIHININLGVTMATALHAVEGLELASFDKPEHDGVHRIFSVTCENVESGRRLFMALSSHLRRVPGLVGKMKFEHTTRCIRVPLDAPALPLLSDRNLADWLRRHAG